MIKGSIQKEDVTIVNIYAPNIGAPQYIRQMLTAMKGKNLQPRLLYPARISFRCVKQRRNKKLYRQAKAKRIQHHQTSSTTNAKGTSLSGKHKRKGPTKANP